MGEQRFMISEASKQVDVEPHVLRYWEEELLLEIPRNEMGHRYFRESDIHLMKTIKYFKEQGFQLKAIKMLLPNLHKFDSIDPDTMMKLKDALNEKIMEMEGKEIVEEGTSLGTQMMAADAGCRELSLDPSDKMENFMAMIQTMISDAIVMNNHAVAEKVSEKVTTSVLREMREAYKRQEEKTEERYKRFDALLRDTQKSRAFAAVTYEPYRKKKKSKFFKKNNVYI